MESNPNNMPNRLPLHRPLPRLHLSIQGTTRPEGLGSRPAPDNILNKHHRTINVNEPQIICPKCSTEIKLTESLAAPLIAETRKQFDVQLTQKEADFGRREAQLRKTQDELAKARETIEEDVANKLKAERSVIAETEAKKAREALADDIDRRDQ